MNENVNGNRKLFWKQVSKVNGEKVESCNRIKDKNLRLALVGGGDELRWFILRILII